MSENTKEIEMDKEAANEKLDMLSLMMLECYDEILIKRNLLNTCLDDAFLNLSKARSLIGCSNLSILQVPVELEPNVTVNENEREYETDPDSDIKCKYLNYELAIQTKQKTATSSDMEQAIPNLPSWFGVLTPLSLKTSHKSFAQSLYIIKSICELQSKLANLQVVYSDLKKQLV